MKKIDWNKFEKMSKELEQLTNENPKDVNNMLALKAKNNISESNIIEAFKKVYEKENK